MLSPEHVQEVIVRPALQHVGLHSIAAEQLVLGTAAQESTFRYLRQLGGGPALGLWQMEPETYFDIWANVLRHKQHMAKKVRELRAPAPAQEDQLATNMLYACAMCRIQYWRFSEALPEVDDVDGQARYWKRYYNTIAGAGTVQQFADAWRRYVSPLYA